MENETEIRVLDEVGSTNDEALSLGRAGAAHGLAVAARRQTAGRGRRGHAWDSPAGNLYLSVVLRPNVGPERLSGLAAVCGLGAPQTFCSSGPTTFSPGNARSAGSSSRRRAIHAERRSPRAASASTLSAPRGDLAPPALRSSACR